VVGAGPTVRNVVTAKAIDFIQQISVEQGLSDKKQPWDEVFPESVLISEERL